ncbi:hypothetical protein [Haloglycomyces albus]|uniref:hypothetical protein n=1 Tax=Haloglycomyces albus TaxID=526067 RepID=UPI0004B1F928|nr:hypothetical protein [Haloglycomyces albus]
MDNIPEAEGPISSTVRRWRRLATRHNVEWSELVLIALNLYGLRGTNPESLRLRLLAEDDEYLTVVQANKTTSPFSLRAHVSPTSPQHGLRELCVDGTTVAEIIDVEPSETVRGYLRANGTAANLNPPQSNDYDQIVQHYRQTLRLLAHEAPESDGPEYIKEVAFNAHDDAHGDMDSAEVVLHLTALREAMTSEDVPNSATISVLTTAFDSDSDFQGIRQKLGPLLLLVDVDNRMTSYHSEIDVETALPEAETLAKTLKAASDANIETSFTLTVGHQSLNVIKDWILPLAEQTTVWPSLTIHPAETASDESQHVAAPDERLDFFLEARKLFEQIFAPTGLKPEPWRCYRGLWYRQFAGEPLEGPYV